MKRFARFTVLACAAALALVVVAAAAASYTPSMGIFQATYKPTGAGAVTVIVAQEKADDPTARIVIYAPKGYKARLTQAPGTIIGDVLADVQVLDLSTNVLPLSGQVKTDSPANWTAQANLCTPGVAPEAVWTLNAALPGQPANPIPVFVSHTTGAEAAFSSIKMTLCFRDPTLPQNDPRRSPNGLKFIDAAFSVKGVFTNSTSAGNQLWRSLFTPYTPGTGTPDAAGTREAQGIVPTPYSISMKRVRARRGFVRFAGVVNIAGSLPSGASLWLFAGVKVKSGITFTKVGSARTRRGKYVFNRRLPKKVTYFFVERPPTVAPCASPLVPCTEAIVSNAITKVVKVAPARKR
ncbi:MAG: hypothetical protein ACTHNB_03085 [Gaiellaceae bacterium]